MYREQVMSDMFMHIRSRNARTHVRTAEGSRNNQAHTHYDWQHVLKKDQTEVVLVLVG